MRKIDGTQFFWLIALCIIASATALFVDESTFAMNKVKLSHRTEYLAWVLSSMMFAGLA